MARCARLPSIRVYSVVAGTPETISIPRDTVAFALQVRTAVGATIRVDGPTVQDYFSLAAGATLSMDNLNLDSDLDLYVDAASGTVTVEVWLWSA